MQMNPSPFGDILGTLDANQREGYSAELAERRLRESFKRRGKRAPAAQ